MCRLLRQIYMSKLPAKVKEAESADFYWKPKDLVMILPFGSPCNLVPCGQKFFATGVKPVYEKAGIQDKTTIAFVLRELLSYLQQVYQKS